MPTGLAFDQAVRIAHDTPSLDIGVHLTLVGERPALPASSIPSLVGADGRFLPAVGAFARRYALGRIRRGEVTRELEAQVARVLAAGLRPTHLDSHQHVHMLPGVLDSVLQVSRYFGVPWIRLPMEYSPWGGFRTAGVVRLAEALALRAVSKPARRRLPVRTDGIVGFLAGGRLDRAALRRIVSRLPAAGLWELVCHPGLADPASPYGRWGYAWAEELAALIDPGIAAEIEARGVRLVSFREPTPDMGAASAVGTRFPAR
jgi:predicted glycoside hydrolase/deacetylase ChbG (UPF0249 family)